MDRESIIGRRPPRVVSTSMHCRYVCSGFVFLVHRIHLLSIDKVPELNDLFFSFSLEGTAGDLVLEADV